MRVSVWVPASACDGLSPRQPLPCIIPLTREGCRDFVSCANRGGPHQTNSVIAMDPVPPARRRELTLVSVGEGGHWIVKNPTTGEYFRLGPCEGFLLQLLDGKHSSGEICRLFEARFQESFSSEDLAGFLELAAAQRLLELPHAPGAGETHARDSSVPQAPETAANDGFQSLFYWRKRLIDPDRLLTWLARRAWFIWTWPFVAATVMLMAVAMALGWMNGAQYVTGLANAVRWETAVLAWLMILGTAVLHEFAHGMTCKHFGGEVHEIGFLLIFLMPGLYCNVSDSWLFPQKSRRLFVMLAGAYCDLLVFSLAVILWRLTVQETWTNYVCLVAFSVTGIRSFMNLNPLLKLDGYYLLSDLLEIPNLRQRAMDRLCGHVRWLLWGSPRPGAEASGRFLLWFGLGSWAFSAAFLGVVLIGITKLLRYYGDESLGTSAGIILGALLVPGLLRGFSAGQVRQMLHTRRLRSMVWGGLVIGVLVALFTIRIADRYGGYFVLQPLARSVVRAPIAGFIASVHVGQGDAVKPEQLLVNIEVPDLESRLLQKQAEVRQAEADLRLLEAGERKEKVAEQERLVEFAKAWEKDAVERLGREKASIKDDLARLDHLIEQRTAELNTARRNLERGQQLVAQKVISAQDFDNLRMQERVADAQLQQAYLQRRERAALGTIETERDLAVFQKELTQQESGLKLMKLGPRKEERDAAVARVARLRAELDYLQSLERKQRVTSPIRGVVVTPYLEEQKGNYVQQGDLICQVEDNSAFEVRISIAEEDAARIQVGQEVGIKMRTLPYETFTASVIRIAPRATEPKEKQSQNDVHVYCRLGNRDGVLRSEMTGYARVYGPPRPIGLIGLDRVIRFLRTEFWW